MKHLIELFIILFLFIRPAFGQPLQKPNFLVVVLDDAEYNLLRPYVPEYINQPGIDSIASQGATVRMHNVQSMCNPSRYSMLTGLYPHNHGATDNETPVNPNFTLLTKVLGNNGYKVAIDGKFTNTVSEIPPKIINKWWITKKSKYENAIFYKTKGKKYVMADHSTQVIHDTAEKWLSSLQTPFFLWVGEVLPHRNPSPTHANKDLYEKQSIPLTPKFYPFTTDYPSYLYWPDAKFYLPADSPALKETIRANYECLNDLSDFLLNAVDILRARGLLDNTFIIIVGDNGFMNGEHMLHGKNKPYKEAMRVPCFIRYAPWFTPGTVVDYTGFQSIDFAATILDAAGINDAAFNSQSLGKSLRYLMIPGNERKVLYFEAIRRSMVSEDGDGVDTVLPSFRSVKTPSYKYVKLKCDVQTEELYDLVEDPDETNNLAKHPVYATVLNEYRFKLDSMAIALNDTISGDTILRFCKLIQTPPFGKDANFRTSPEVSIIPNPANESLRLRIASPYPDQDEIRLEIFNTIGRRMYTEKFPSTSLLEITIPTVSFVSGVYFLNIETGTKRSMHPFVIEH